MQFNTSFKNEVVVERFDTYFAVAKTMQKKD